MGDSVFKHHTYGEAVKKWNEDVFGKSIFAFPRKGYTAYNQVQDIRAGKDIDKPKSIADLKKVQEPKKAEPKKEEKKAEPKKAEPRKTKAEKEAEAKAKAEKKESSVKLIIKDLMQSEPKNEVVEKNISKEQKENMNSEMNVVEKAPVKPKKQKLQISGAIGFENRPQDAEEFYLSEKEQEELKKLRQEYKTLVKNEDGSNKQNIDYKTEDPLRKKIQKYQQIMIENIQNKLGGLTFSQFEKLISYKKQLKELKKPISGSTAMYYKKEMSLRQKIQEIENKLL